MSSHNCHFNSQGQFKCWGSNDFGKLGLGDTINRGSSPNQMGSLLPFVNVGTGSQVDGFCLGLFHTCVHLAANKIKCWGFNGHGQLGLGDTSNRGGTPSTVPDSLAVVNLGSTSFPTKIVCGQYHTCVLFANKKVKCFGSNQSGSLGVEGPFSLGVAASDMGDNLNFLDFGTNIEVENLYSFPKSSHNCIIISTTQLMKCWGSNTNYQLGYGDSNSRGQLANTMGNNLPTIDLGSESRVTQITIGESFTCALRFDDQIKCWGQNMGQFGLGTEGSTVYQMGNNLLSKPKCIEISDLPCGKSMEDSAISDLPCET